MVNQKISELGCMFLGGILALLLACIPTYASAQSTIKIGASTSLTGGVSREGQNQKKAYVFWMDLVNAKGGIQVGNRKLKVSITCYDDQSVPMTAAKLYERLITEDGIKLLLGPFGSASTFAATSINEKYRVPMSHGCATAANIFERGYKYSFGVPPTSEFYTDNFFKMMDRLSPRPNKLALLTQNTIFPLEMTKKIREHAKTSNFPVVYDETFATGSQDLSTEIVKIKRSEPDVISVMGLLNETMLFTKQAREASLMPKLTFIIIGPTYPDWRKSVGEAGNNVCSSVHWDECFPFKDNIIGTARDFIGLWQQKYGFIPDMMNAADVAACLHLQLAIEKAGSIDPEKVKESLAALDTQTFYGRVKFDTKGRNIGKGPCEIVQIQNGRPVLVYPPELACTGNKLIYPAPSVVR